MINEQIRDREVRVIGPNGEQLGIMSAKEAYFKALGTGIKRPIRKVEILYTDKGKPYIANDESCDLSISHDGEYAMAVVVKW